MVDTDINEKYHVDWEGGEVLDEYGYPIPIHICICAARSPYECCCGAWDVEIPNGEEEQ